MDVSSSKDGKWLTRQNECYVEAALTVEAGNSAHLDISHGSNGRRETDLQHCDDRRVTEPKSPSSTSPYRRF